MANFDTHLIHKGDGQFAKALNKTASVAETLPIYLSSAFAFDDVQSVDDIYENRANGYIYSRAANPNIDAVSEILAAIENGAGALVFGSGMAAITTTILSLVKSGDNILASRLLYGGTYDFFAHELPKFGVTVTFADIENGGIDEYIKENTKLVYTETIANPLMSVPNIRKIAENTHKHGLLLLIDNTFASPVIAKPLDLGADIVLHSATKYLGGHSDILLGAAVAKTGELAKQIRRTEGIYGGVASPQDAWLLARSLRTLSLRVKKHSQNALKVAEFLEGHGKIEKVFYSGLSSSPSHENAVSQFEPNLFGGMISANIKGGAAEKFIGKVELFPFLPSLAGTSTTLSYSVKTSHRYYEKEKREELGITDEQVRFSIGLEDADDIIAEFESALKDL